MFRQQYHCLHQSKAVQLRWRKIQRTYNINRTIQVVLWKVRTRRSSSEGGTMLLTVAHQNRSSTLRGGSTTVPIEQSDPFHVLVYLCYVSSVFSFASVVLFYSDEGSDTAAETSVFFFYNKNPLVGIVGYILQHVETIDLSTVRMRCIGAQWFVRLFQHP